MTAALAADTDAATIYAGETKGEIAAEYGGPNAGKLVLTISDVSVKAGASANQPSTLDSKTDKRIDGCTGHITITGGASLAGKVAMVMPDFNGPGQDLSVTFAASGSDLNGHYPDSGGFPLLPNQAGATTNKWNAGAQAKPGTYQASTEIHDGASALLTSDTWTLTVEAAS